MTDILSAFTKIQIEGARYGSAGSESLIQAVGGSINGIIDHYNNLAANNTFAKLSFGSASITSAANWISSNGAGQIILAFCPGASTGFVAESSSGQVYISSDKKFMVANQSSSWSMNGGSLSTTVYYAVLTNTNIVT